MCSFLVTNKTEGLKEANFFLQKRGPDFTNIITHNKITFIHNLLHLTGKRTLQPFEKHNNILVFNGEIYNYGNNYANECDFIQDCYFEHGNNFYKFIDGEYSLVITDFNKNKIIFSGDVFLTKPIFFSVEGKEFGICSYESGLRLLGFKNIERPEPNYFYSLDLKTFKITKLNQIHNFNLEQNINTFELWNYAFENSIKKRIKNIENKFVVPLSSGHDSGVIVSCLNKFKNKNYLTYSFLCNENNEILYRRLKKIKNKIVKEKISFSEYRNIKDSLYRNCEKFQYGLNYKLKKLDGLTDDASVGLYKILSDSRKLGIKVVLSGQGGDEIYGNNQEYGFNNKFNPKIFPKNLKQVFPWPNFYYGGNYSYILKEECIAGCLGIEARYPLLDIDVVQQFLNIKSSLKNKYYKAPLTNYLNSNNFPYFNGKLGFKLDKQQTNYLNKVYRHTNIEIF